jgi:hypothetical protein
MSQKRGNIRTTQGQSGGASTVAPAAGEDAAAEYGGRRGRGDGSGARSRGAALTQLGRRITEG